MRKLTIILFVLVFAITGNSQQQSDSHKLFNLNSIFAFNEKSIFQNTFLSQNSLFDEQDTNDLDGIDFDFVFPDILEIFQQYKIKSVVAFFPRLQTVKVNELLLDLPPPVLSV